MTADKSHSHVRKSAKTGGGSQAADQFEVSGSCAATPALGGIAVRRAIRDEARAKNVSVSAKFMTDAFDLDLLAMRSLCSLELVTLEEIGNIFKHCIKTGDIQDADISLALRVVVELAQQRMPKERFEYIMEHDGLNAGLTRAEALFRASLELLVASADLYNDETSYDEELDDLPPPPDEDREELGPLSVGEVMALASVIGSCGEILRRHAVNGDLPPQPELDAMFATWRGQRAGDESGRVSRESADKAWRNDAKSVWERLEQDNPQWGATRIAKQIQKDVSGAARLEPATVKAAVEAWRRERRSPGSAD